MFPHSEKDVTNISLDTLEKFLDQNSSVFIVLNSRQNQHFWLFCASILTLTILRVFDTVITFDWLDRSFIIRADSERSS